MNVACGMEMSISPKLCGAEVYACNAGKMKCWFGRGTKPTGTNGDEMERIYRKHTENQLDIFLFTAQLMGGGEILWSELAVRPEAHRRCKYILLCL